jgi:tetratricopeptide (TPR) repeat protein
LNALTEAYLKLKNDSAAYYAILAYNESKKINYIHGIAESLSYKGQIEDFSENFPRIEKLSCEALDWYRKTSNKKGLGKTYWYLGYSLYAQSFFSEAIKNFDSSYDWCEKAGDAKGMYWALATSGSAYEESGNYEKAFEFERKSLSMAIKNKDDDFRRWQLIKIGSLYWDIEDYKTTLEYYRQAFENLRPEEIISESHLIQVNQLLQFADLFTLQHEYDSARYYYSFVDTSNHRAQRFYLTSIGSYYFSQKQYDKALLNFLRGLEYHKQYNDRNQVMSALLSIANTYSALGNNDLAFKYASESLGIAKQTNAKQVIRDASKILSFIYDHWQRTDSAYFYYKQYTAMNDSVLSNQIKGKLAVYGFEQKIELLKKEKEIQNIQLQKESLVKNIFIGGIIILLVLAVIIFRVIMLKRKNEKHL